MEGSDALMAIAISSSALACPHYLIVTLRLRHLLPWAVAGGPPVGRQDRPGESEPVADHDPRNQQETGINMVAVYIRSEHARLVVAGFAASTPSLGELWQQVDQALADVPALGSVIARLTAELASARLDRANLIAAIRAALAAQADGEADPLSYLRDELVSSPSTPEMPGGNGNDA
jgi:hypothetical protein